MGKLYDQLERTLLPGMTVPPPIRTLFEWIEANGTYIDNAEGQRRGFLFPLDQLEANWTDTDRPGGTIVEFFAQGNLHLNHWFGHEKREVLDRVCVFAKTGGDGSMAAFWIDDSGSQKIVHLGSGSGSTLVCVLAEDPVDFLRLIAIGYDEICWGEMFPHPPNRDADLVVRPHLEFQNWVSRTFHVTIPATATEIVKLPTWMGDHNPSDEFAKWVERHL